MPKKLTNEEFIAKAVAKHKGYYDYSKINYLNSTTPITITCPKHGEFSQVPYYHLNGNGCKLCAWNRFSTTRKKPIDDFINESKLIHGDFYDYSQVDYKKNDSNVTIICPVHGSFKQTPYIHHSGSGCPLCYRSEHLQSVFLDNAKTIHSNKYDYSLVTKPFIYSTDYITIICPKHGEFQQQRRQHLMGRGCPHPGCCRCPSSKSEKKWIESLKINTMLSPHRLSDLKISVDGYDPTTKTVYEFYGDFWHGNPKIFDHSKVHPVIKATFKTIYDKTLRREEKIKKAGYIVISIWESDWLEANNVPSRSRKPRYS